MVFGIFQLYWQKNTLFWQKNQGFFQKKFYNIKTEGIL